MSKYAQVINLLLEKNIIYDYFTYLELRGEMTYFIGTLSQSFIHQGKF